jgi:Fe-S-cluster containining protein
MATRRSPRRLPKPIVERLVPCDGCVECCRHENIFLHPECGDRVEDYQHEFWMGRPVLRHWPNGDCWYLDPRSGCMIYDRRPVVCKELDCAIFLQMPVAQLNAMLARGEIRKSHIRAAWRRVERERSSGAGDESDV